MMLAIIRAERRIEEAILRSVSVIVTAWEGERLGLYGSSDGDTWCAKYAWVAAKVKAGYAFADMLVLQSFIFERRVDASLSYLLKH